MVLEYNLHWWDLGGARMENGESHRFYKFLAELGIRIHWIRIQPGPRVLMSKNWRKNTAQIFYFFDKKLQVLITNPP